MMYLRTFFLLLFISKTVYTQSIVLIYSRKQENYYKEKGEDPLSNYRKAIEENGGKIVKISPLLKKEEIIKRIKRSDGVLIPGGVDIDPSLYKEEPSPKLEEVDMELDQLELFVFKLSLKYKKPIMGICRGFQFINVALGGSLYQDIPSMFHSDKKVIHRIKRGLNLLPVFHKIKILKGSLLYKALKKEYVKVNSYHHQGIKKLAKGLKPTAWSEDGLIEAFEANKPIFIIGIQFHPEKLRLKEKRFNNLFYIFIKKSKGKKLNL